MPDEYPQCPGESIKILYQRKKKSTHCYQKLNVHHGWCGTCDPDAEEGQRGFCPDYAEYTDDSKRENTIVKKNKNWGFCSELCTDLVNQYAKTLQETKITILKDKECKIFAPQTSYLEFRAGKTIT